MQEEAAEGLELFPEEEVVPYLPQFVKEQEETVSGRHGEVRTIDCWRFSL